MDQIAPQLDWKLAVALVTLMALTLVVARVARLPTGRESLVASVRAFVQLMVVSAVIGVVLRHVWSAFLFVGVMATVATVTTSRRSDVAKDSAWVGVAILSGAIPVLAIIFLSGSTPLAPSAIVALGGIVIGNSMNASTLLLRRAFAALRERRGEVEAGLSLGFTRPQAIGIVVDRDRAEALIPAIDQTRTVGLVTLPGAFVGVLLGGGSAGQAAAAQILVLVGLLAAETIAVAIAARLVGAGRILPDDIATTLPPG